MRRNVWTLLAVMALLGSLLAGCGGGKQASSPSASQTPSSSQTGEASTSPERVTIRFYTHGTEQQYNWSETIAAFEAQYPHIKVELIQLSEKGDTQEATQKLDLAAASGDQMDVLMFSDPTSYAKRVSLGMVAPIDEFIEKEGYKVADEYKVDTVLNGQYYALPGKFNPWYVLLNKDHLEEAGLEVPKNWTWDDFAAYAKALTKGEGTGKRYGTYFHGPQNGGWFEFLKLYMGNQTRAEDTDLLKPDGSSNLGNPLFRQTLELRVKMERDDKSAVPYADMLSQKLHYRMQFFNQNASMILIGSWMNSELGGTDQNPLHHRVAVAPYPKNQPSDPIGFTPVTTDFMAVAARSKHKEEAYTFIRWYTTEGLATLGYNIPSWKKVREEDMNALIDRILSNTNNPELVDKESLIYTLSVSQASPISPPAAYQAEVYKAVNVEFEKLILGSQTIDQTLANMESEVQKIIEANT